LAMMQMSDISHVGWQGRSIDTETHHALVQVFASLPDRSLLVFLMSQVDGLGYAEIARELGLSRPTVRRAMLRAIVAIDAAFKAVERSSDEQP
jgi:RNA polymerase sigma factor (sigma-70 family)